MFIYGFLRGGGRVTASTRTITTFESLKTIQSQIPNLLKKPQSYTGILLQRRFLIFQARSSPKYTFAYRSSFSNNTILNLFSPSTRFSTTELGIRYNSTAPSLPATKKSSGHLRIIVSLLVVAAISFSAGSYFVMASIGAQVLPKYTDAESAAAFQSDDEYQREVEKYLNNHVLIKTLRSKPEFTESRPHMKFSEAQRSTSLTAGALAGPGKIVVPPIVFMEEKGESMVMVTYLGTEVCGYPGFVHGGLLATLLDEGLARCAFQVLPNKLGMTASLQINYKKPTLAGQYIVLRAKAVRSEGRKAWVEGHIETLPKTDSEEPVVLVEANGLFIEPKQFKLMSLVTGPVDA